MVKKVLSSIVLSVIFLGFIPAQTVASNDNYFVVTAYYSPLPNQKHYLKGNYEDEKTLNGQGIAGASGKPVFSGMLAAPGKYGFGTKIHLEGLGVGVVEDRGGAIVPAGKRGYSYDRIDIWVGYGDEGLRRALYWGKRTIKGSVVSSGRSTTLNYKTIPAPLWATNGLKKVSNVFHTPLGKGSNAGQVMELQKILKEVGKYNGEIDGIYNSEVIDVVYNFQIENGIMKNSQSYGAGYWGASTRNAFFKKYISGEMQVVTDNSNDEETLLQIFDTPLSGKESIQSLQNALGELSLYEGEATGDYKDIRDIIYNHQISREIVSKETDIGAGVFGPKTRASLKKEYTLFLETKKRHLELEKLYSEYEEASAEEAKKVMTGIGIPKYGAIDSSVRSLQVWMNKVGYFDYKDTAIFGVKTKNSIIEFQKDKDLIQSNRSIGAGIFGPKTRTAFENEIKNALLQEKLEEEGIFEEIELMKTDAKEESVIGSIQISTI